jgi:glyoxylase-like metal-dependent hydrolase (beta-lactamase superfamily II)
MELHILPLGDYQTNTYIVSGDGKSCAVIDPGFEPQTILAKVRQLGLTVEAVLLTHGHFDHVGGVKAILAATGCPLYLHRGDFDQPDDPMSRFCYPLAGAALPGLRYAEDGDSVTAGGLTFRVLSTPGHTKGSVCFQCEDVLFSGDTLFAGSCGRTDLPGGDWNTICRSLARLAALEEDLTVYPGHGPATTLQRERCVNPYMR